MFKSQRSQRTPNPITESVRSSHADAPAVGTFSLDEMTHLLQVPPEQLRQWSQIYPNFLEADAQKGQPRYSRGDLATLIVIQRLLEAGHEHEQVMQRLQHNSNTLENERPNEPTAQSVSAAEPAHEPPSDKSEAPEHQPHNVAQPEPSLPPVTPRPYGNSRSTSAATPKSTSTAQETQLQRSSTTAIQNSTQTSADGINVLLRTVSDSQQSMLNVQDSIREMLGVIVQDNFNLKHENRKLRDRMLELERTLAEYQRREETRKERMEGRLRALESTLSAIQQQVAQLVQLYRQRNNNKRGWFR